jgi:hypothetical protein
MDIDSSDYTTKPRWAMLSDMYTKCVVADMLEHDLLQVDERLLTKVMIHIALGYRPELDVMDKLDPKRANYYQDLIWVL